MKHLIGCLWLSLIAAVFCAPSLPAQSGPAEIPRILRAALAPGTAPKIDGILDDAIWKAADPATNFVQREPNPGNASSYRTIARVAYDDDAVYVALRMFDERPGDIISRLTRRDDMSSASDRAGVYFDSYRDRRTAFGFLTTPRGAQVDALLSEDTREDFTWDAVWEVETRIDSLGWTAEFRIPLSQLRYSGSRETNSLFWGLQFVREHGSSGEISFWAPVLPNSGRAVSLFGELRGDHALQAPRRLEVLPYTLAKVTREPGSTLNPFYSRNATGASAGADVKYGISSSLTLTATINPDFGQVEADPSIVNLGSFETFFTEKRPFFTEGSEFFRWSLAPEGSMLYSRRIGRAPQRTASIQPGGFADSPPSARILAAAKLSGKTANGWGIGVLHAITERAVAEVSDANGVITTEPVEPLTNYSVVRLARDFRNGRSGVGFIGTSTLRNLSDTRLEFLRDNAFTSGINWFHRFGNNQYQSTGWLVGSRVHGGLNAINAVKRNSVHRFQRPDAYHIDFDTTATSMYGWGGESTTRKIAGSSIWAAAIGVRSPGLDVNEIGFQSYADVVYTRANFGYRHFQPGNLLRSWTFDSNWIPGWSFGGEQLRNTLDATFTGTARNLATGSLFVQTWLPVTTPWDLRGGPGLKLPMYTEWSLSLASNSRKRISYDFTNGGTWFREDAGYNFALMPRVTVRPSGATTLSFAPRVAWNRNQGQFIRTQTVAGKPHYIMGDLHQTTGAFVGRASLAVSPTLAFDLYAQPFVSGGTYRTIKEVTAPGASAYGSRYTTFGRDRISFNPATNRYSIDLQPDGVADFSMPSPNFNVRQLRSNAVMRWEYRPGSTLYLVWTQARDDARLDNGVSLDRDFDRLFAAPAKNIFLLKVSYWLTP
ncbi:MAG: carbohydrate binding family 9 domain-containing protein [Gemmatimonadaceae bacterium]|nr:carbohydrate binding family 9 domain-containing protein [Gemmatimonadaceae bacterium]